MAYEIRQLSFGEVLDQSLRILKDNFLLLSTISAAFYLPYTVAGSFIVPHRPDGVPAIPNASTLALIGGGSLAMLLFLPLMQLAISRAVADCYLASPPTVGAAFRAALKLYVPYQGTCLLFGLALLGLMFLLVIPALYFAGCWLLVGPIAVVEGVFGAGALKRSRALTRGYWWRSAAVIFVSTLLGGVVSGGVNLVVGFIPVLGPLLSGAVQAVAAAFGSIAVVVLYVDLRCRKEDFDLQLLAQAVRGDAALPAGG